jgi:catalase
LFDAIIIPPGLESIKTMAKDGRVIHWIREAFGHCKTIGAIGEGVSLLRDVVHLPGIELASKPASADVTKSYGVITAGVYNISSVAKDIFQDDGFFASFANSVSQHRCWEREVAGLTSQVAF